MRCTCECKTEPTQLQKEEKAARAKWLHYQNLQKRSPSLWSPERSQEVEKKNQEKPTGLVAWVRTSIKGAKESRRAMVDMNQKVLENGAPGF